uniref:Uncharacterized protein n=1 Tax=Meloidogyne incognita TaxID=6306 RepID=A0A914KN52_MELIC
MHYFPPSICLLNILNILIIIILQISLISSILLKFYSIETPNITIIPTCPQIIGICEKDETTACNWHLSELQIKCPQTIDDDNNKNNCLLKKRAPQCSAALSRFVRFVSAPLVEAMLFCNPSPIIEGMEEKMLPSVLRLNRKKCSSDLTNSNEQKQQQTRWSCTQTAKMCKAQPRCNHYINNLLTYCPTSNTTSPYALPSCLLPDNPTSLRRCRLALTKSRGTWLDEPCFCKSNGGGDFKECKKWEMTLWPRHPCIEKVATDFNQLYIDGYIKLDHKRRSKINNNNNNITLPKKQMAKNMEFGSIERGVFLLEEDKGGKSLDKEENIFKEKINRKSTEKSDENFENNQGEGKENENTRWRLMTTKTATPPPKDESEIENKNKNGEEEDEKEGNNKNKNKQLLSYYLDKKEENETNNNIDKVEFIKKRKRPIGRKILGNKNGSFIQQIDVNEFQTPKITNEGRGCRTRNIDGEWVEHYTDSIFRQYHDWSGRCSSWCECVIKGKEAGKAENASSHSIRCHSLGCLQDLQCETKHTTTVFGQRLYLENRGACQCHNGQFICDSSELQPELQPGIYLSLGYSQAEIDIIREKVPKLVLERSGLISHSNSLIKDLATRLQFALEKLLPSGLRCRFVVVEHFKSEQVVLMQIQWFGIDHSANQTQPKWQSGKMEKHCSQYVRELELNFWLEKSERYQLLLSTIKQVRATDLLDALPLNSSVKRIQIFNFKLMIYLLILIIYRRIST